MAREQSVTVGAVRLYCRRDGAEGEAPWVVFGNSLVTDLSIWDAQVAALGDRFRVLRYDQRGHGQSSAPDAPLDVEVLGSDLLAVLNHFEVERCTYVGLSMGVPTGLSAHAKAPARFERLVFVDGQARTAPTGATMWAERKAFAKDHGMERVAEDTVRRWLQPPAAEGPAGDTLRAMVAATPLVGFVRGAGALQGYDYLVEVGRIRCPLLAIAGACDGAMPETMTKTFGDVPGARIVRIPEAGHVPNFERPDAFNDALLQFLSVPA